ncbi:ABC transporter permease subunit [Lacticaseibacillus kribbianus]|uniref:ABC transporter permease subunit n=1 Tax=Lacticaseibacillus kribbianus TaxID=2926292 RepID=UPI001CD70EEB|nr:ABC transporter permease subunit [Lacticaseibacillus kribbianus]
MGTLIKQEFYKLFHKTGTWIAIGIMVGLQIAFAIIRMANPDLFTLGDLVTSDFMGGGLVIFLAVAATASIVAQEFQFGTMKQLLYRKYYRSQVFVSKVITMVLYLVFLQVIATAVTVVLSVTTGKYDWLKVVGKHANWETYSISVIGFFLVSLLLLSVVLLLSTLLKSNAAAVATGIVGYFLMYIASGILIALIAKWEFVKWSPFTFLMVGSQLSSESVSKVTQLSTPVMVIGSLAYTALFTVIAYLSFRKRSV